MKLYKFKSFDEFEYIADIILNNRLYAAQFTDLNDPMEGLYIQDNNVAKAYIQQVSEAKKKLRICSLSKENTNLLMWAHYANGHRGVCIEIEVDNDIVKPHKVNYTPFSAIVSEKSYSFKADKNLRHNPIDWATIILGGEA